MLNDVSPLLYNLYYRETLPCQSHIICSPCPLPTSYIVNPIWPHGGRCWKCDLEIWLCIYNSSFWRLTQAIVVTKVLWHTNCQIAGKEDCVVANSSSVSFSMSQNFFTPLYPKESKWVHWALSYSSWDRIYVPRLKGKCFRISNSVIKWKVRK